jgi:hypothetical protein
VVGDPPLLDGACASNKLTAPNTVYSFLMGRTDGKSPANVSAEHAQAIGAAANEDQGSSVAPHAEEVGNTPQDHP